VQDGSPVGSEAVQWALRFISGKYQGGEFPLRPHREIVIGRSSELDMVLVEDMVSRKHAKITTDDKSVTIQDLGSTNGTFVNGEKIRKVELKDGDRILIGTSIVKLVHVDSESASLSETEARSRMAVTANRRPPPRSMSGSIEEIPLPDLLQLLSTSRKSGVLVLRSEGGVGKIYMRKGQIYFASIDDSFNMGPRKAIFRMLSWTQGFFELEPPDDRAVLEEMQDSTEGLLMEGMRQLDEHAALRDKLPPLTAGLTIPRPLEPKLRDLTPEELDVFQIALTADNVRTLFEECRLTDLTIAEKLKALLDKGYLIAGG
jgi:pSer/pThr/pTyr-binding forkhead associated (FHA) protein